MKKKGFTLIELLAVILILGIIALIAIPTVNNILTEARRGAFISTLNNLEKAIEEKCTTEQIKNTEITTTYAITDGVISPSVDIKGDLPDGTIIVNTNCEVSFTLSNNNFTGSKEFAGEIEITEGSNLVRNYKESILNGADPVLSDNLIPVTIANDGTVTKADLTTKWYSYAEKKWANAVILTESGKVEDDGTILEDSIESYFVWIPRYKYKLFNMGNYDSYIEERPTTSSAKTIEIVFENKDTTPSVGTAVGQYHSHPAFQAFDVNGLWIGKFETSGSISNLKIKPNKNALTTIEFDTIFETAYDYKRENDSHLIKNTEWGAVAYLSLSNYGINKNINDNNNNNYYKTGYSAGPSDENGEKSTHLYNTEIGYQASTTGNISGIYDMSGGALEYVAASNWRDASENYDNKYLDLYLSSSIETSYNNRILGDATGEMGPFYLILEEEKYNRYYNSWFDNGAYFVDQTQYYMTRGGKGGNTSNGQLSFGRYSGGKLSWISFRIALAN